MSMKPVIYALRQHGMVLGTRGDGREVGRAVADGLRGADALVLDFWGVEVASPPFLDELLSALHTVLWGGNSNRLLVVAGFNEDVRESLEIMLERRGSSMAALESGQLRLLGGSKQLRETLEAAQEMGHFAAPELAERLRIKLPNLHARLKTLTEAGAVGREEDAAPARGRSHRYRTPNLQVLDLEQIMAR